MLTLNGWPTSYYAPWEHVVIWATLLLWIAIALRLRRPDLRVHLWWALPELVGHVLFTVTYIGSAFLPRPSMGLFSLGPYHEIYLGSILLRVAGVAALAMIISRRKAFV